MTEMDPGSILKVVTEEEFFSELKDEAKADALAILPVALEYAKSALSSGAFPKSEPSSLGDAVARAEQLDAKLAAEIERRERAKEVVAVILKRAIEFAAKAAIVAAI